MEADELEKFIQTGLAEPEEWTPSIYTLCERCRAYSIPFLTKNYGGSVIVKEKELQRAIEAQGEPLEELNPTKLNNLHEETRKGLLVPISGRGKDPKKEYLYPRPEHQSDAEDEVNQIRKLLRERMIPEVKISLEISEDEIRRRAPKAMQYAEQGYTSPLGYLGFEAMWTAELMPLKLFKHLHEIYDMLKFKYQEVPYPITLRYRERPKMDYHILAVTSPKWKWTDCFKLYEDKVEHDSDFY